MLLILLYVSGSLKTVLFKWSLYITLLIICDFYCICFLNSFSQSFLFVFVSLPLAISLDNFNFDIRNRLLSSFTSSPRALENCITTSFHSQSTRTGDLLKRRGSVITCICCQNGYHLKPQLGSPRNSVPRHHSSHSHSDHDCLSFWFTPSSSHLPKFCYSTPFDSTAFLLFLIQIHVLISLRIRLYSMDYHYAPSLAYILNHLFLLFLYHPPSRKPTLDKLNSDYLYALPVQLDIVMRGERTHPCRMVSL